MSTARGIAIGAGGFLALCAVVGAAHDIADSTNASTQAAVSTTVPAPVTVTKTNTVRVTTPAPFPPACTDYINQVDAAMQAVLDYDSAVSEAHAAEEAGSNALADHNQTALSAARTKLNQILNSSTGPFEDLYDAKQTLINTQVACKKATGG